MSGACVWALALRLALPAAEPAAMDAEACVAAALAHNAGLADRATRIQEMEARLREVRSVFWPKLSGVVFVAPMYTVRGDGYSDRYEVRWRSANDWGAYTNLDTMVVQPLSTFGRASAGATAARERLNVERAGLQAVRTQLALEVRKLYLTALFARSMQPTLAQAVQLLGEARTRAGALYAGGGGEVSQIDLAKLDYGASEAKRFLLMAQQGAALAGAGLAHLMGRPAEPALLLADASMPPLAAARPLATFDGRRQPPDQIHLEVLQRTAELQRAEWAQLRHGRRAARAWQRAEQRANFPTLFLAGTLRYGHAPTRDTDRNPWHFDNYNTATGGLALGLKFDLDPALAAAKAAVAAASFAHVEALGREARTGIALQVRKAHAQLHEAREATEIGQAGLRATRQWMASAATAYQSQTGEARELLEGLAAYVQAKRSVMESLRSYHLAAAELQHAVGGGD